MARSRPTSFDVARLAGVSRTTVSFVLNGRDDMAISRATRDRVFEAARSLGYEPNAPAAQLARGSSLTIGLALGRDPAQVAADALLPQIVRGVGDAARGANYLVLVESLPPVPGGYRRLIGSRRIDGLIVSGPLAEDIELRRAQEDGFPIVLLGPLPTLGAPSVGVDNVAGAKAAVSHLIDRGHTTIALITNAPLTCTSASERLDGYRLALSEGGIEFDPQLVAEGAFVAQSGLEAMAALLGKRPFTAVFVASDVLALGAMAAIRAIGLRIPADISLVGFDDIPLAAHFDPPLTTVGVPAYELGRTAGNILLALIKGEPVSQRTLLDPELRIRESVGPGSGRRRPHS
ncbi:MAG: LacI family DNA-binding transcriptional regulator [Candidatus Limnocylindrales bacterium]|jgi:LacI family transcriptional regulator